jgi:outer membrane immunogenic protein
MTLTGKLFIAAAALAAFSGSAMAADLYVPPAAPSAPMVASTNWDGPYIGASLGYMWANNTSSSNNGSFLVGAQLGYNAHLSDMIVGGVEGNIDWINLSTSSSSSANFEGSIRARLGVDVDNILPYLEAGVAFANIGGSSSTNTGYTLGAGVEFMIADQLSANVEYRYDNYGSSTSASSIRVGLNYHF